MKLKILGSIVLAMLGLSLQAQTPDAAASAEARLREALRNTMLQLRTVQEESAAIQAKQAQSDGEKVSLKEQLDSLNLKMDEMVKKNATEKEVADKAIAVLQSQASGRDVEIARLNQALEKWKEGYKLAVNLVQAKEDARAKAVGETILLQRKVTEREAQNLALFKLGGEILTRYQKYSLGDALAAKEPFTGIARARLEELVQDYQDKLLDQRVKPGGNAPPIAAAPVKP